MKQTRFNLGDLFDGAAMGDRVALIDCRDWDQPETYSYAKLDALADACARGLLRHGLKRGSAVAILSGNRAEFLHAYLGAMRAGLVAVPVNFRFPAEIVAFIMRDARIELVLHDAQCRGAIPAGIPSIDFDEPGPNGFQALLDPGPFETVQPSRDETAMVLYTSGSSGRPKGVLLSHAGQLWAVEHRVRAGSFAEERLLIAAPLFHMNALATAKFAFAAGASLVLLPRYDAPRYLETARRFRCSWLTGVPTMFALAVRAREASADADFSFVKYVRMGSAPATQGLMDAVKRHFSNASILLGYGTTESGPVSFGPRPGFEKPDNALGWPAAGVEVRFADGAIEGAGEGVLLIRTPAMMTGYLNLPEKTREVLSPDGWYNTGDMFRRAADGCYSFAGRADDMINCGGENIFPAEVEALLTAHPDIAEASVVGLLDEIKGEKPVAFVVLKPGARLTEEAIKRYALDRAPAFQHPRRVKFVTELPLAGTNKIDRNALKRMAEREWSGVD